MLRLSKSTSIKQSARRTAIQFQHQSSWMSSPWRRRESWTCTTASQSFTRIHQFLMWLEEVRTSKSFTSSPLFRRQKQRFSTPVRHFKETSSLTMPTPSRSDSTESFIISPSDETCSSSWNIRQQLWTRTIDERPSHELNNITWLANRKASSYPAKQPIASMFEVLTTFQVSASSSDWVRSKQNVQFPQWDGKFLLPLSRVEWDERQF